MDASVLNVGIDIGSTTIKVVVLNQAKEIIYKTYARHFSEIGRALHENLVALRAIVGQQRFSFALTGSAGMGVAQRVGLPFVQEVVACAFAVRSCISVAFCVTSCATCGSGGTSVSIGGRACAVFSCIAVACGMISAVSFGNSPIISPVCFHRLAARALPSIGIAASGEFSAKVVRNAPFL